MNQEKSVDLRELFCYVLKRWRIIVVAAIIIGIFAGITKFVSDVKSSNSIEFDDSNIETAEQLEAEIQRLQDRLDSQLEYNENSVLMKINPMNEYIGSIMISFKANLEPDSKIDGSINKIVAAYSSYLSSSEFFNYLIENCSFMPDETKYAKEIISCSANMDAATVSFNVNAENENNAQRIIDITKQAIENKYSEFAAAFCEFEYSVVTESVCSYVSSELKVSQDNNYKQISELNNNLELKETELASLNAENEQSSLSYKQIAVASVKNAAIGAIAGLLLAVVCFATWGILTRKMWGHASWNEFGINTVYDVCENREEKKLNKFDSWIEKLSGIDMENAVFEKSCAMAAVNIKFALKNINALTTSVVSISKQSLCEEIVSEMNKTAPNTFVAAGDILHDSDAVLKTMNNENVVLIAVNEESSNDDVRKLVANLDIWGKKLLGVILVK